LRLILKENLKSLCVLGGKELDNCNLKNDLDELYSKLKEFLDFFRCLFVENRRSKKPKSATPTPLMIKRRKMQLNGEWQLVGRNRVYELIFSALLSA
jgi:hypothetical protein